MLRHIRKIDVEFHSYCNRVCEWCPNKEIDRQSQDIIMPDEIYSKLLDELAFANFGFQKEEYTTPLTRKENHCVFGFLGNQEAFTQPELFKKRVQEAYDKLPLGVRIIANSNGDMLSRENLDNLMLTTLDIMDYDCNGMDWWADKFTEEGILVIDKDEQTNILTGVHRHVGCVRVRCNWPDNWPLEDKAGFFKQGDLPERNWLNDMKKRDYVCYDPSFTMIIAYDGSVMPCCHMRPDNPDHKNFILGNVKDQTLAEIYNSTKAVEFRQRMLQVDGDFPAPCTYCQKSRPENFYNGSPIE